MLSRILFFGVAYGAVWLLAESTGPPEVGVFEIWSQWDAVHLARVSEYGYTDPSTHPHATVFFPLFPLLLSSLSFLGLSPLAAGLLISGVASLIALSYLYRLAEEDLGAGCGGRAIIYLAFFPTALFLVAPYTEALFLAGAIPAFYHARRSNWMRAALPAAVAMASRNTGIFLLLGLGFEFIRQRDFRRKAIGKAVFALAVGVLPLIAYGLYLLEVRGEFFYWVSDYRSWGRTTHNVLDTLATSYSMTISPGYPTNWMMAMRGEFVAAIAGVAIAGWAIARREWGYAAFAASLLLVLFTSPYLYSSPRSMLQLFPSVLFLADFSKEKPGWHDYIVASLASIAILGVITFTRGGWFY